HAAKVPARDAFWGSTLETRKTSSRRPAIASPTSCSASPALYISAVSIWVMLRSMPVRRAVITAWRFFCSMSHVPCPMIGTSGPVGPKRWYCITSPSRPKSHLLEILVLEPDGHGTLADCGGDALDRTGAYV